MYIYYRGLGVHFCQVFIICFINLFAFRVQNEQFSKEKGFIHWYWKGSIVSAGIRTLDPWITGRTLYLPPSYLTCWWMGIKLADIKYQILCLQINQVYAIVAELQIVNNSNTILCKNSSNINISSYHRCLFDKKMWQECCNRSKCSKIYKEMSWSSVTSCFYYWKSTKLFVSIGTFFCVCLGVIHVKNHLHLVSNCL